MSDHPSLDAIREEERKVRAAVKERLVGYILAAFGFVAGLAWNNAITGAIDHFFPKAGSGVIAQFIYAIVLTVAVAVVAYYISRLFVEEKK
ncbi:MAG: hypothetical protein KGI69_00295 [Patescibacteria group bacterium]|nr:hypothetical protein [Patescibacteria group bacterium]